MKIQGNLIGKENIFFTRNAGNIGHPYEKINTTTNLHYKPK